MKSKQCPWILFFAAAVCAAAAIFLYMSPYVQGYERQDKETQLALSYLQYLQKDAALKKKLLYLEETEIAAASDTPVQQNKKRSIGERWRDDVWYELNGVTYTPDYAAGKMDCVLLIPKIRLCRGVYTGTWEDIYHNLEVWMATTARPDYCLGKTHYCIYGHNTPRLNLSFNRLQSLEQGDVFFLVNQEGAYQYQVTKVFGISRSESIRYTDDFSLEQKDCYLITCGRNQYQYLDLIVQGRLQQFTEWSKVDLESYFMEG